MAIDNLTVTPIASEELKTWEQILGAVFSQKSTASPYLLKQNKPCLLNFKDFAVGSCQLLPLE